MNFWRAFALDQLFHFPKEVDETRGIYANSMLSHAIRQRWQCLETEATTARTGECGSSVTPVDRIAIRK